MAKRPSLSELTQRKGGAAPVEIPAERLSEETKRAGAQPDGRKGILVRVAPEGWRQLRDLAADLTISSGDQVSMQSLIVDQINKLLRENGRPPLA